MTKIVDSRFLDCKKGYGVGLEKVITAVCKYQTLKLAMSFYCREMRYSDCLVEFVDYVGKPALSGVRCWRENGYSDRVSYVCKCLNIWKISM